VQPASNKATLYFDGSCALCQTEIGYYRRRDQAGALCFVDVSTAGVALPAGVSAAQAMKRFHVSRSDGQVLSGAAAFVEIWARLPQWRWVARLAALPGVLSALEVGYRMLLPIRPPLSRFVGRILRRRALDSKVKPK
jgi:predicted DCC family thiol-disulfide oxidoreductase YuxK